MVYVHFPTELTEEELMLKKKFQQLRKKKNALSEQMKSKPQRESLSIPNSRQSKDTARDAKERAKKLLKSGVIGPIIKESNYTDKVSFKKPCGMKHKFPSISETLTSYQPFSAPPSAITYGSGSLQQKTESITKKYKNLYDQFVPTTKEITPSAESSSKLYKSDFETPPNGLTIYVGGTSTLTEEFLRTAFNEFGAIINISVEITKSRGFITFDTTDNADRAVANMNNKTISGIKLKVSISRNQLMFYREEGPTAWNDNAITKSSQINQPNDRSLVAYNDVF